MRSVERKRSAHNPNSDYLYSADNRYFIFHPQVFTAQTFYLCIKLIVAYFVE